MAGSSSGTPPALALNHLIALNDEMAALVRAGVPLDVGLTQLGADIPGRVGQVAQLLGQRLESGQSLAQVLEASPSLFPSVWRAVVLAGLKSGHLASALESLSVTSRRLADLRRGLGWSLIYPLTIVFLAYLSFLLLLVINAPIMSTVAQDLTGSSIGSLEWMVNLRSTIRYWGIGVPLVAFLVIFFVWYRSGRGSYWWESGWRRGFSFLLPAGVAPLRDNRWATWAEILALLLRQQVPLPEGLVLASEATGDQRMTTTAKSIAERLNRGEPFRADDQALLAFPPMIRWMLAVGAPPVELARTLTETAHRFRRRAARGSAWLTVVVPLVFTVLVAGGATFLQGLATFGPLIRLFFALGEAH